MFSFLDLGQKLSFVNFRVHWFELSCRQMANALVIGQQPPLETLIGILFAAIKSPILFCMRICSYTYLFF